MLVHLPLQLPPFQHRDQQRARALLIQRGVELLARPASRTSSARSVRAFAYRSLKKPCAGCSGLTASPVRTVNSRISSYRALLRSTSARSCATTASAACGISSMYARSLSARTVTSSSSLNLKWWLSPGCVMPTAAAISRSELAWYPRWEKASVACLMMSARRAGVFA